MVELDTTAWTAQPRKCRSANWARRRGRPVLAFGAGCCRFEPCPPSAGTVADMAVSGSSLRALGPRGGVKHGIAIRQTWALEPEISPSRGGQGRPRQSRDPPENGWTHRSPRRRSRPSPDGSGRCQSRRPLHHDERQRRPRVRGQMALTARWRALPPQASQSPAPLRSRAHPARTVAIPPGQRTPRYVTTPCGGSGAPGGLRTSVAEVLVGPTTSRSGTVDLAYRHQMPWEGDVVHGVRRVHLWPRGRGPTVTDVAQNHPHGRTRSS